MIVAVDVGYGFTKVARAGGRRCCFPSAVAMTPGGASALAKVLGAGSAPQHRVQMQRGAAEPETFLIGEAALAAGAGRSWEGRAAERGGYDALVFAGLGLVGAEGPTDLRVGLPLGLYLQPAERAGLRQRLAGLAAWVSVGDGTAVWIEAERVRVLPQGAGAFASAVTAAPDLAREPVGLIDVGYRTTDLLLMRPGGAGLIPDEPACGSFDAGAGRVYERVRRTVGARAGVLVPEGAVEDALAHLAGRLIVRGREYDLGALVNAEAEHLATEVATQVRRLWSDRLDFLGTVLLAGGGGALLLPHLGALHPALRLLPDPVYANAAGFLLM